LKFDEDYFTHYSSTRTKEALNLYFNRLMKETIFEKIRNKKLLDIGCAYGYFLKIAGGFGFETYGIDISQHAVEQAKKKVNAKFFCRDVQDDLPFADGYFEIITMFDVIEHLEKPYDALREIRRVLKSKGLFVITTPNVNSLLRRNMGKKWIGFGDETHIILYSIHGLKFLLRKAGFRVLKAETFFTPLPQVISKLLRPFNLGGKIWITSTRKD